MSEKLTPTTLGKVLSIKHGYPFLGEYFSDKGELVVLTPGNFYEKGGFKRVHGKEKYYLGEFPDEYLCSEGDLVVAMTQQAEGLLGSTAIIPENGIYLHNQRIGLITHNDKQTDKMYLYYLFMTSGVRQQIRAAASGSKVKHTSPERIYDVKVWLPDLSQQKAIVTILGNIDRKIALNNAINAELEKAATLLYDYWFVQFDFPDANGKPYRASGGAMEYNEQLKREIPKGWKVHKFNEASLFTIMSSGIDTFAGEKIYLSTSEVDGCEIVNHTVTIGYANRLSRANMQPRFNSVWFAKMKDTVKNILVNEGAEVLASDYIFSTGFAGLQCIPLSLYYVWNYLRDDYFEKKKNLVATGATQQAINDDDLKGFDILIPPEPLLERFNKIISPYYHLISKVKFENKDLTTLRNFLLPLLMNGQVTVAALGEKPSAVKELTKRAVFKRLVLSAYILDNICDEPTAGRVKFEKLLYLSEYCAQLPLHSEFQRAAAGPYDSKSLYSIESQLNKNKWFKRQKIKGESRAYRRLGKVKGYKSYVDTIFNSEQKDAIDKLLNLLKTACTIQCEIVATLYGAWNDFLIDGIQPTDSQIVDEVLTNWHEKKERIDRNRWLKAIEWMRKNGIIPVAYGVSTKRANNKERPINAALPRKQYRSRQPQAH
jgi:type I restriction enzyme S subunit